MPAKIVFGTDGWRGVIADEFTFQNIYRVARATAQHYKTHKKIRNGIVVGYDARFMSKEFAEQVALVFGNEGIPVLLSDAITTTPAVSLMTREWNAAAGIVITASHNPAKYNGYKIKGDFGGPAFPEMITKVERRLSKLSVKEYVPKKSLAELEAKKKVKRVDLNTPYIDRLRSLIDLELIASSGLAVGYDAMYGAGQNIFGKILTPKVSLRAEYNPSFGGANPEPLAKNLADFLQAVPAYGCHIGIATDGDADRVGAVDENGRYVDAHRIFALVLRYLVEDKKMTGEVAKSFTISEIINKMCAHYGITMHLTAVGFKYLCRLMIERDVMVAGEESGGIAVKGHIPERDGVYIGLLLCEMLARKRITMSEAVDTLMGDFGPHYYDRIDAHLTEKEKQRILKVFGKHPKTIGPFTVTRIETVDGVKFFFGTSWLLVRASGTEPLIRYYAEAESPEKVQEILNAARAM